MASASKPTPFIFAPLLAGFVHPGHPSGQFFSLSLYSPCVPVTARRREEERREHKQNTVNHTSSSFCYDHQAVPLSLRMTHATPKVGVFFLGALFVQATLPSCIHQGGMTQFFDLTPNQKAPPSQISLAQTNLQSADAAMTPTSSFFFSPSS